MNQQYQNQQYPQQQYPPPPPPKQPMGAGKVILIVIGVIMAMGMGTCVVCTGLIGVGAKGVAEEQQKEQQQQKEAVKNCEKTATVAWEDVAKLLEGNEAATAKSWKGSCQKVSGVVQSIDSGFDDKPVVIITAGGEFEAHTLRCTPASESKAMGLTKGSQIVVWGLGGGEIVGSLQLDHCDW